MTPHHKLLTTRLLAAFAIGLSPAIAAEAQPAATATLNDAATNLEAGYAAMLQSLIEEISAALPAFDAAQPVENLKPELEELLTSEKLDAKLAKFALISEATPRGLAEFAQQGSEHKSLVDQLLADTNLMRQMVTAGASENKYGQAMKIYTDIQKASTHAKDGILQRFALGTSLEHAVPVGQRNPVDQTNAPATVDPVKRYLGYEKAFLAGELDPGFKDLSVWECRMIGNGDESDEVLAWGREMLRNYYPDHITNPDYRWRYVELVKTDVKYGSKDQKSDSPSLGFYQNIINTGGVCGRRAFFGRFILRCFGIPSLARPQPGHATLVHWTPDGWVICLGASWGNGKVNGAPDTEFLTTTQARMPSDAYLQVLRARWLGAALAEKIPAKAEFWNKVSAHRQQSIIEKAKAATIAAVGTDIGEANESKEKETIKTAAVSEADKKIVVDADGVITIPAVACSKPSNSTPKIRFMKSHLGGMQLHYGRLLEPETFEYTFDAPAAGKYALNARVVTVSPDQHLFVAVNEANEPADITVPYTLGKWDKTPPVEISLTKGRNVLRFSRPEPVKGLTVKDFTLTPVK